MNPEWFGDSFDIVKRYFVENIKSIGYHVVIDPMLTGDWVGIEENFYHLIGASPSRENSDGKSALLLDPDTGIGQVMTEKHVTIEIIASQLKDHDIVFSFDQSFSRTGDVSAKMKEKLAMLGETGNVGFYYNSHARFLFSANLSENLQTLEKQLLSTGLPASRLLRL